MISSRLQAMHVTNFGCLNNAGAHTTEIWIREVLYVSVDEPLAFGLGVYQQQLHILGVLYKYNTTCGHGLHVTCIRTKSMNSHLLALHQCM